MPYEDNNFQSNVSIVFFVDTQLTFEPNNYMGCKYSKTTVKRSLFLGGHLPSKATLRSLFYVIP